MAYHIASWTKQCVFPSFSELHLWKLLISSNDGQRDHSKVVPGTTTGGKAAHDACLFVRSHHFQMNLKYLPSTVLIHSGDSGAEVISINILTYSNIQ